MGKKIIQFNIQFKIESKIFIQIGKIISALENSEKHSVTDTRVLLWTPPMNSNGKVYKRHGNANVSLGKALEAEMQ